MNQRHKKFKIILIASLVLNLAFISGVIIQKYFLKKDKKTSFPQIQNLGNTKMKFTGYKYLVDKNPEFQKHYNKYRESFIRISDDLVKLKQELFSELKKDTADESKYENILKKINQLTSDLNTENYRHFILLKKILKPQLFQKMLNNMTEALNTNHESHFRHIKKEHLKSHQNKNNHSTHSKHSGAHTKTK